MGKVKEYKLWGEEQSATKHDQDKVPVELVPTEAIEAIAEVLAFGAQKYSANNWRSGFKWSRLFGACLRHIYAHMRGQNIDPESGLSHLAHAGCCIMFLITHETNKLGEDDRYKQ